ncbi:bifunctional 4-hydroxy-2-oxoglutarate aldolase/2-dehydro-3-deoxy-phosphogluconate aldolase [Streptomyces sp. S1]|uniref:bifunctional 4-hydroxy-2-oxoglutarate aldolase/2-dehydro-3-deoxy-phosphogluconate aldolase n=1 Tax=Streptomyces sp. S1 TaxID=718288 RepID=UPI000EF777F6|nr:bifunctional 4-hydroxy-2-oxoglutarate aldolase/2-dehydro-3-deoxy-phosphogluconate aldolase [Streptomyces sp. S1]
MQPTDLLAALRTRRLVAIVRGSDAEAALDTVLTLAREGVDLIEVSLSGRDAPGVIKRARAALGPDALLGAGTVVTVEDARLAAEAGASYVVTPAVTEAVAASRARGLPVLAGAMTPTEVAAALAMDATAVKLFPAGPGGVELLRALRGPFPDVPFVPVGGVDAVSARAYLAAGALAVGVGSPLVGRAADGDASGLHERITAFRTLGEVAP